MVFEMAPVSQATLRVGRAFTLVELLVVVAIIAVLATLAINGFSSVTSSTRMEQAARMLAGDIDFARQAASSRNENVEIRFSKTNRPNSLSTGNVFWQWQVVLPNKTNAANFTPLRPRASLPEGVVIDDSATHSPLLKSTNTIVFRPSGEMNPVAGVDFTQPAQWCLTLVPERQLGTSVAAMSDFVTIQINPLVSRPQTYRP